MICESLQVILRIQMGPRGAWGAFRGSEGVNGNVAGIALGHWVCLMGFLMIHKAYICLCVSDPVQCRVMTDRPTNKPTDPK